MKRILLTTLLAISTSSFANIDPHKCLTSAYPDIKSVDDGQVLFKNGKTLPLGVASNANFTTRLKDASIADQLSQTYPLEFAPPKQYANAGRLRNDVFLRRYMVIPPKKCRRT